MLSKHTGSPYDFSFFFFFAGETLYLDGLNFYFYERFSVCLFVFIVVVFNHALTHNHVTTGIGSDV